MCVCVYVYKTVFFSLSLMIFLQSTELVWILDFKQILLLLLLLLLLLQCENANQ